MPRFIPALGLRIVLICLIGLATNACKKESTPSAQTDPLAGQPTVFMGTADRTFYALDALTGNLKWKATTPEIVKSSPIVSQEFVYALSEHQVYALDTRTGQIQWTFSSPDKDRISLRSTLVVNGENVYFVGGNGHQLYALDARTGTLKWEAATPTSDLNYGIPTVVGQKVYIGSSDNHVYVLDAQTGRTQQQLAVGERKGGITGAPLLASGTLYVGSYDGNLYALDAATGQQQWIARLGGWLVYVRLVDQALYANSWQEVFALDAKTGTFQWRFKPATSGNTGARSLQDGTLYGGYSPLDSPQIGLYALDAATGTKKWAKWAWPGDLNSDAFGVVAANGLLYIAGNHHQLYALDAATGETKWTFSTSSGITTPPCVVNKEVFVY